MPVPDSTIQTKSFKAKKIKISNEWCGNLSETTGISVEEIAKFLTKVEWMKCKKTQKIWLDGCHLLFEVYRYLSEKKVCLYPETVLGPCRQYVLKKVYEEVRKLSSY